MTAQDQSAGSNLDYLDYCTRVANGRLTIKHGRPVTEHERLECQHVLNQKAARAMGATTLFSLLNGVHIDDVFKAQGRHPELSGAWMSRQEEKSFMSTAASDIASGKLVVYSLVHLLRCNDTSEVRELVNDPDHPGWFAMSIRLVVTDEDARGWLARHYRPIPDWLCASVPTGAPLPPVGRDADLQGLLLGMAKAGYGHKDGSNSKAPAAIQKQMMGAIGREISVDIIRNRIKEAEAATAWPSRPDAQRNVLLIILTMAKDYWGYGDKEGPAFFQGIADDLAGHGICLEGGIVETILKEAKKA